MAGITPAQAQAQLTLWIAADAAVATGQSYSIGGRSLSRADAAEIRKNITYWQNLVQSLEKGGMTVRTVIPRDL